jgi:GT2 family glycosyltransferase
VTDRPESAARAAVIIVNYNGGQHVERTLESLVHQTRRADRVIVVDNASSDGSPERVAERFPAVELIRAGGNVGFAKGNNIGLDAAADCDWIVTLNPDAFPEPEWLERWLAAAERSRDYAFFGCLMLAAGRENQLDGVGDIYHASGLAWREGFCCPPEPRFLQPKEIFAPCAAAALYRRDALAGVGGFDEDFFCYLEDVDLGFRLRLAGQRCLYVPEAIVHHVGSAIVGDQSDFQLYHGQRNMVWTFVKDMPGRLFWLYLPYHVALNLYHWAKFSLRGRAGVMWRAKRDALAGVPRAWRKRREIQGRRRASVEEISRVVRHGLPRRRETQCA